MFHQIVNMHHVEWDEKTQRFQALGEDVKWGAIYT